MNDGYLSVLNGEDRHGVETRGTKTGRENGTDVCVIYLSALSVHRAEQRANIVFTHTHGFAMQIIWYYCTYSAYRRGSSVTGTASNPSFLPRHPLASSIYLRDTRALYTYRIGIGVSCYCCFFPRASIIYGKTFFRICIDEESSLDIALLLEGCRFFSCPFVWIIDDDLRKLEYR